MTANSPDSLSRAIASVKAHALGRPTFVFDDSRKPIDVRSNNADSLTQTIATRRVSRITSRFKRHGALYANMRRALRLVETKYILFIQDDMQLVRHIHPQSEVLAHIADVADRHPNPFIYTTFWTDDHALTEAAHLGYVRKRRSSGHYRAYSDVFFGQVKRIQEVFPRLDSESAISSKLVTQCGPMLHLPPRFCISAYMPYLENDLPFERHRKGTAFVALQSPEPEASLPLASLYLDAKTSLGRTVSKPWLYR